MLLRSAHISSPTGPVAAPCFFPSVTKASMGFVQRALVIRRCNRLFLPRAPLWTSLGLGRRTGREFYQRAAPDLASTPLTFAASPTRCPRCPPAPL